jgi:hypothetical protein
VACDLLGNGKTALKVQLGRYVSKIATYLAEGLTAISTSVNAEWTDANKNLLAQPLIHRPPFRQYIRRHPGSVQTAPAARNC